MEQLVVSKRLHNYYTVNTMACINCNKIGHFYKRCPEPITSYGIILISIPSPFRETFLTAVANKTVNNASGIKCDTESATQNFVQLKDHIKFLMVQRKFTLGFSEFIRGKYDPQNYDQMQFLFEQMTDTEIKLIWEYKSQFEQLWTMLWENDLRRHDMLTAKAKFDLLVTGVVSLEYYCTKIKTNVLFAEWGFPKGRRTLDESEIDCGVRECCEETGYSIDNYHLLDTNPYVENLIGTDGKKYKHIYWCGVLKDNITQTSYSPEIGDIQLLRYEETLDLIRPYHDDRKTIVSSLFISIMNTLT